MQGTVNKIWHNHRADGSDYWAISIEGQRYVAWEREIVENIHEGDLVEFAFSRSGRYLSLTALKRVGATEVRTENGPRVTPEALRRVRVSCLRSAAEMLKDTTLLPEQKAALATSIAERLEKHVLRTSDNTSAPATQQASANDDARGQDKGGGA